MLVFVLRCNSLLALTYCVWGLYVLAEEKKDNEVHYLFETLDVLPYLFFSQKEKS